VCEEVIRSLGDTCKLNYCDFENNVQTTHLVFEELRVILNKVTVGFSPHLILSTDSNRGHCIVCNTHMGTLTLQCNGVVSLGS